MTYCAGDHWTRTACGTPPPEDVLLDVIAPSGEQRQLIFDRGLWYMPDKAMYCYFVPTHWRVAS